MNLYLIKTTHTNMPYADLIHHFSVQKKQPFSSPEKPSIIDFYGYVIIKRFHGNMNNTIYFWVFGSTYLAFLYIHVKGNRNEGLRKICF